MASERRRHSSMVLNLTPLIDIVFLLLVFFMLTAHFIEDEAIPIDLPEAANSAVSEEKGFVEISMTPDGQLRVDGHPVEIEELEESLRGALHAPEKRFVRLKGDHKAQFGLGVKIIDAARAAGAESLDILTERP
ncbi:MAG: biopolymer transporter ExbD [Candidatus Thiodiazotropha sp. (ex Monitilora ramsayi)]|nr:biopolymer transporter ExbD [Candidatus Thiodiazotropha sp. (ex Monitilora ramsayi)]